jgi:hypothetical protein
MKQGQRFKDGLWENVKIKKTENRLALDIALAFTALKRTGYIATISRKRTYYNSPKKLSIKNI